MYGIYKESFIPGDSTVYYEGVLGANITRYSVWNQYIIGFCEVIPNKGAEEVIGYFIINTNTHEVLKGLNKEKLRTLLKEKGFQNKLEMNVLVDVEKIKR